jgi:NAD(P)H-dependent FMN reductase
MIHILAIAGSVRAASTNAALVRAAAAAVPEGVIVEIYDGLGELPIFNPDLTARLSPAVEDLRARVLAADGLLIASPEYAHGIPGGLKNALDWIVGWGEVAGKPVAILHASEYGGEHARAALAEVLTTMSLSIIAEASFTVHLRGKKPGEAAAILADPKVASGLHHALAVFAQGVGSTAD